MDNDRKSLEFFISEKAQFIVISLSGPLDQTADETLARCQAEALAYSGSLFVLNMRAVEQIDSRAIPPLVRLQKALREKPGILRVCFLSKELKDRLLEKAALREAEVTADLMDALSSLQIAANLKKSSS